jgi:hypothetical protein
MYICIIKKYRYKKFIRGAFAKLVDSPYYSKPELCGTTLHSLLGNGVTAVLKEHVLGWRSNFSGASALRD